MLTLSQAAEPDPVVGPEFAMDQPVLGMGGPATHHTAVARGASGTSLAVWAVGDDIYGARVDSNGTVLDASAIPISTAPYEQSEPAVTYDGSNWVVVWSDGRSGSGRDIHGARVSSSGAVLDPNGFVVSALAIDQVEPDISAGATNSLVVWTENYPSRRLSAGRVSSAGVALDGDGVPLTSPMDSSHRFMPALSFGGTSWLLVWQEFRLMTSTSVVRAIQLTDTGTGIGSTAQETFITTLTTNAYGLPAAAHDGANWLVSWSDGGVIRGARVAPSGALLDTSPISIAAGPILRDMPAVAAGAGNFLVLWKAGQGDGMFVAGRRVNSAGVVLDTVDLELGSTYFMPGPAAAYDGSRWLAVWPDGPEPLRSGVSGKRIATDGSVVGDTVRVAATPNRQILPAAASNGTVWLVAWCDHREGNTTEVYGTRVSAAGTVLDTSGIPIATASGDQCTPAVASNGTDWFVAWHDYRSGTDYDIYGARVSAAGTVLDPSGLAISTAAENQMDPAVSASGTAWLVVWEDQRTVPYSDVYGARVSATGEVLDPTGIPLSAGPFYETAPAVAVADGRWLVAWQELRSSGFDIYGTRVGTDGTVLDANGIPLTADPDTQSFPALSSDGTNWLALWNDLAGIRGTRVNGSGVVLDPSGIPVATTRNPVLSSVSHDGVRWLAAWQDSTAPNSDVHATRLDSSGSVLDPSGFAISESPAMEEQVAVAGGRAGRFVVAYHSNKGPEARVRARVVCVPVAATDATCDAIDDDCSGAVDEDYTPVPTQCGTGTCTGTGTTSCVNGAIHDDCVPDLTDQDSDGVPDCADACPMTPAMTSDGCPEGGGGAGGSGQAGESGEAGGGAAGSSGSAGRGGTAGIGGAGGRGGSAGDAGDGGDGTTGGDAGVGGEPGGASGGGNGDSDDGGCGCRLSSRSASQRPGLGLALLAVGLILRRRRRDAR